MKMGGLGANIGSEEWEKAKRKKEFYAEFGKQIRMQNLTKQLQLPKKEAGSQNIHKEKSTREKAMDYVKSLPRPKAKSKQNC